MKHGWGINILVGEEGKTRERVRFVQFKAVPGVTGSNYFSARFGNRFVYCTTCRPLEELSQHLLLLKKLFTITLVASHRTFNSHRTRSPSMPLHYYLQRPARCKRNTMPETISSVNVHSTFAHAVCFHVGGGEGMEQGAVRAVSL